MSDPNPPSCRRTLAPGGPTEGQSVPPHVRAAWSDEFESMKASQDTMSPRFLALKRFLAAD